MKVTKKNAQFVASQIRLHALRRAFFDWEHLRDLVDRFTSGELDTAQLDLITDWVFQDAQKIMTSGEHEMTLEEYRAITRYLLNIDFTDLDDILGDAQDSASSQKWKAFRESPSNYLCRCSDQEGKEIWDIVKGRVGALAK